MKVYTLILILVLTISLTSFPQTLNQQIKVTVTTDKSTYTPGELVTITVIVTKDNKPYAGCLIGFEIRNPKGEKFPLPLTRTDSSGKTYQRFKLKSNALTGKWIVIVAISGTSIKGNCTFTVTRKETPPSYKKPSSITLELSSDTITYGECVLVRGEIIIKEKLTAEVRIESSIDNITWSLIAAVTTTDNKYNFSWYPPRAGVYFLRALWTGTDEYNGAISSVVKLIVLKVNVTLKLTLPETELVLGEKLVISGKLEPTLPGIPILIEYKLGEKPWISIATVTTNNSGCFSLKWTPPLGVILIKISWSGDENYNGFVEVVRIVVGEAKATLTLTLCDPRGRPLANALVEFYCKGTTLIRRERTDINGVVSLTLPVGNYVVKVLWKGSVYEIKIQLVKAGIALKKTLKAYDLTVKVVSKVFGIPIPAVVTVTRANFTAKTVTDHNGVCVFRQLPLGRYNVKVKAFGITRTEDLVIEGDRTIVITVHYSLEYLLIAVIIVAVIALIALLRKYLSKS